jgi:hypothetical protein
VNRRFGAILVLLAVFAAGAATGFALGRRPMKREGAAPPPAIGSEIYAPLDLSADQRSQIDAILQEALPRTDTIMTSAFGRLRVQLDEVDAQVRRILDARQNAMLDSIRAETGDFAPGLRLRRPAPR